MTAHSRAFCMDERKSRVLEAMRVLHRPQTYALPRVTLVLLSQDHPRQLVPDSRYQNGCDISRFFSCCSCSPKFSSTSRRVSSKCYTLPIISLNMVWRTSRLFTCVRFFIATF